MTVAEMLRDLPHDPARALEVIEGIEMGERADPRLTAAEKEEVRQARMRVEMALAKKARK